MSRSRRGLSAIVTAAILIGIFVVGMFTFAAYQAGWFNKLSVLSISNLSINSNQGNLNGYEVTGTYWNVLATTDNIGNINGFTFNNSTVAGQPTVYWQGKAVTVGSSIQVNLVAGQPYIERPVQHQPFQVTPAAYQNYLLLGNTPGEDKGISASALSTGNSWVTTTSDWVLHTPFAVNVYVNGTLFGSTNIDNVGTTQSTTVYSGNSTKIGNNADYVTITNLGQISHGYSSAPIWQQVIWWNDQYFFYYDSNVQKAINNPYPYPVSGAGSSDQGTLTTGTYETSYAWYWYGGTYNGYAFDKYWTQDGTPFTGSAIYATVIPPTDNNNGQLTTNPGQESPGWIDGGGGLGVEWRRKPSEATPPLFPTDPKPSGSLSLMDFLQSTAHTAAQRPLGPSWDSGFPNDMHFVQNPNNVSQGALRLYMPVGAYSNLITILISSDLADTVIESLPVANIKIQSINGQPVTQTIDIGHLDVPSVQVPIVLINTGSPAAGYVKLIKQSSDTAIFYPPVFDTGTMQTNIPQTFTFAVQNLGESATTRTSFTVQVYNHNPTTGDMMTDSATVYMTLDQIGNVTTILQVETVNANTGSPISGIHIICNYGTSSLTGDTSGGSVSFNFGGASPFVSVTAIDYTNAYNTTVGSLQLTQGPNTLVLKMYPVGQVPPTPTPWLLIAIIATVIVAVAVPTAYVLTQKKKGGGR